MKLNLDTIRYISEFLKFDDILSFSISCKENYNSFDELFYNNLAHKYYGDVFGLKLGIEIKVYQRLLKILN